MNTTESVLNTGTECGTHATAMKRNECVGDWRTGISSVREGAPRRLNVFDVEIYLHYLKLANELRGFGIDLAKVRSGEYQRLVLEDGPPNLSLLVRLEEHINKSGPIFISNGGFTFWDKNDMAFWQSLEESEVATIDLLLVFLWVEGRIEIFCPRYESQTA